MSFLYVMLLIWVIIAIVAVLPYKFGFVDFVFMYFVNCIAVVLTFTTLMLNMKLFINSPQAHKMIAFMMYRIVGIPLLLVLAANIWFYPIKVLYKWILACIIFLSLNCIHLFLTDRGMMINKRWSVLSSVVLYLGFMVLSSLAARWFVRLDRRDVRHQ